VSQDYAGIFRPQGANFDPGAFEDNSGNSFPIPTATLLPPDDSTSLGFYGPTSVKPGDTFSVDVVAQNVADPGLYGIQFEITYDPALISVHDNLQVNAALPFIVRNTADNTTGHITLVASQQGKVAGLTGQFTLLAFEATALDAGTVDFVFENEKMSDSQVQSLDFTSQKYTLLVEGSSTPEPTTQPANTPTPQPPSEPTPIPDPTIEPTTQPNTAKITGNVILAGRNGNDWSDAIVTSHNSGQSSLTSIDGQFSVEGVTEGLIDTITADAPGYLSAVCQELIVTAPETILSSINLLSGDVDHNELVDITDATIAGASFGKNGPELPADITQDQIVDIFDIVLVTVNFGEKGPQIWNCMD